MSEPQAEKQSLSAIDPTEHSATELAAGQYIDALNEITSLNSKIENIQNATTFISRVESAVEKIEDECDIDKFSELEDELEVKHVKVGRTIFEKLDDTDVLYQSSDRPKKLQEDFEDFCDAIVEEYSTRKQIESLRKNKNDITNKLGSYPGGTPTETLNLLREKLNDYEDAQHLLTIKDGQCDLCKTKWGELDPDRQQEITDSLNEYEDEYGNLEEDKIEDKIDQIEDDIKTVDELKDDLNMTQKRLKKLLTKDIPEDLQRLQDEHGDQE